MSGAETVTFDLQAGDERQQNRGKQQASTVADSADRLSASLFLPTTDGKFVKFVITEPPRLRVENSVV